MAFIETKGTVIAVGQGDGETVAAASDTFDTVGQVTSFSGGGMSASAINVTNLASTFRNMIAGRPGADPITFNIDFDIDNAGQANLEQAILDGEKKNIKMTFSDASVVNFKGIVLNFNDGDGADDDIIRGSIEIQGTTAKVRS